MTSGMLSVYARPDGARCKELHCGERVGAAERGAKNEETTDVHRGRRRDAKQWRFYQEDKRKRIKELQNKASTRPGNDLKCIFS